MDQSATENMRTIATIFFAAAVLHTFATKPILTLARRFKPGSVQENLLQYLGEIEIIFGVWAAALVTVWSFRFGTDSAIQFIETVNFTEPALVFVIMCMSATKPIMSLAKWAIDLTARALPIPRRMALYIVTLIVGPILGSLITEPAAMTVTALLLKENFFDHSMSTRFRYATLGLLFVSISIGGTLTHFAAPPVLMVAAAWKWDTPFMLEVFGWRSSAVIVFSTICTAIFFRKELTAATAPNQRLDDPTAEKPKLWLAASHLIFIALTIFHSHHVAFFIPVFLFFLGWCAVTKEYQDELRIRESLLVAFFLGGLVTLGQLQDWWLKPLLADLGSTPLFWGSLTLTAVTDNAALTYLGTLVPNLTAEAKYALVAGAVAGGGLTVIANAPNPAGYGLLRETFGEGGINPLALLAGALPYTVLAAAVFLI